MSEALFLGLLSGAIMVAGHLLYIRSILRGETTPNKVTWLIIAVNSVIILANQIASGVNDAVWGIVLVTVSIGVLTTFAIRFGVTKLGTLDIVIVVIAAVGLVVWQILEDPLASVIASAVTSVISVVPTFNKLRSYPGSENTSTWLLASASTVVMAFAVEPKFDFLLVPLTWVFLNLAIAVFNLRGPSPQKPAEKVYSAAQL